MKRYFYLAILVTTGLLVSCSWGNQPVVWKKSNPVDYNKKLVVNVSRETEMPENEIVYLRNNIETEVGKLFSNTQDGTYNLNITITKYDSGNAGLRFVFAGLGKMYLYGTVSLVESTSKIVIKEGEFKKKYSVGGIVGASASFQRDLSLKVGKAIAKALKKEKKIN